VQAISILLPQAAAGVVEMIENTKAYCRLTITLQEPLRRRCKGAVRFLIRSQAKKLLALEAASNG
jgi:hypothetical protein